MCTWKPGVPAGSFVLMFMLTSPIWFDGQAGVVVHEQLACEYAREPSGWTVPMPPANWSPSSTVIMKSVLLWSIPSLLSRWKNAANASS